MGLIRTYRVYRRGKKQHERLVNQSKRARTKTLSQVTEYYRR